MPPFSRFVVRLWYPSPATAFLTRWRIHSAAGLHRLPDRWESDAVAARTSLVSRICERLLHPNLFRRRPDHDDVAQLGTTDGCQSDRRNVSHPARQRHGEVRRRGFLVVARNL
jgi:hypothetical protein